MKKIMWCMLLSMLIPAIGQTVEITIVTEDYPPYNYQEGDKITGYSTEVVEALLKETGIIGKILMYPWPRAYKMALTHENVLIYTITRTEEREQLFKWVGPISPRRVYLYKLRERKDIHIDTLEEAKHYQIGVMRDAASTQYLMSQGFEEGKHLQIVVSQELNFKKLFKGRIDLLDALEEELVYRFKTLGLDYTQVEKVYLLDDRLDYYLGFSLKTSDEIVMQFRNALEKLKQDGTLDNIRKKYTQ